jgi:hypothetical protein
VNDARNTSGQAYGLTVLTPIRDGHEARLARYLDLLEGADGSPLAHVPGTHFARWVVVGDVIYEGRRQRRDHLKLGRLLFTSNFDGPVESYLEALRTGLAEVADAIWDHCEGYPGHSDPAAFAGYMRRHQIESALFFAAYGDRTVEDVKRSLAVRREVIDFALSAQGMGAEALQAAFKERFAP